MRTLIFLLLLPACCFGQVIESVVTVLPVIERDGQQIRVSGMGVIVSETHVLTAGHVAGDALKCSIVLHNGQTARDFKIIETLDPDLCLLEFADMPSGVKPLRVAKDVVVGKLYRRIDQHRKQQTATPIHLHNGSIYCNGELVAGDSGGPLYNDDNELVGITSGGWFWLEDANNYTWPSRFAGLKAIQKIMRKVRVLEYGIAQKRATAAGEPFFVFVTGDNCPPCERMKSETFWPMVDAGELDGLHVTVLNATERPELAKRILSNVVTPSTVYYERQNGEYQRMTLRGYQTKQALRNLIGR